jgi:hypothetical protein
VVFVPGDVTSNAVTATPWPEGLKLETPMNTRYLSVAMMGVGLLFTAPSFAQTAQAQKQHTEGGGSEYGEPCSRAENANPSADPDCKWQLHNLTPSPSQGAQGATGQK